MKKIMIALLVTVLLLGGSGCAGKIASFIPSGDSQSAGAEEGTGEILTCFNASNYILSFDHTLTVNEQETSLTHILKQGGVALMSEEDSGAHDTTLQTALPQTLDFEYMGVVGPCAVDAAGKVTVSAEGYCEDGIVYLNITESWGNTEGTMTCDDEVMPFSVPGYSFTHTGEGGGGEEFLITDDSSGYTLMKPFLGGEGYHSWTLQMDVDLVPLVPEE